MAALLDAPHRGPVTPATWSCPARHSACGAPPAVAAVGWSRRIVGPRRRTVLRLKASSDKRASASGGDGASVLQDASGTVKLTRQDAEDDGLQGTSETLWGIGDVALNGYLPETPVRGQRESGGGSVGNVVMPPHPVEGVSADVDRLSAEELADSAEVYNAELSWLAFNWRVLSLALEEDVPLYERLKFLAIASENLDGFFAKRVGGLMRQREAGIQNFKKPFKGHWTPQKQLWFISQEVKKMVHCRAHALQDIVLPRLRIHGFRVLRYAELSQNGQREFDELFEREIELLLTPIKLDPGHPFPYLPSGSMNLAVLLRDPRAMDPKPRCAIIHIPLSTSLRRWMRVPSKHSQDGDSWEQGFIPVEEVIVHNLGRLFGGMELLGVHAFRVTRNAELDRQEEEADDLLDMISDELRERRFAPFVRLEVDAKMPNDLAEFLAAELDLNYGQDVYRMDGLIEQYDLLTIPDSPHKVDSRLKYTAWSPATHPRLKTRGKHRKKHGHKRVASSLSTYKEDAQSIFSVLREGDLLVHHPYQGFTSSTQRFVEEAAEDPHVLAIKATLYRTTSKSPIISALLKAKENGKHVAVLVELKARFDEARNVSFAQRLEEAGCNIAYGLVGVKTHAKTTLVVRREQSAPNGLRCYCHIGTGNYNPKTAKVYTDFGLLTCDPDLSSDVVDLFKLLTGLHSQAAVGGYKKLVVASEYMRQHFYKLIDREIENASKGKKAAICVKVNGLDDQETVLKLYEACKAGVRVDAIVRGICRLRPRVPGVSDDMRVVSTVGRFLEHSRVFCFYNDGKPLYFIGSADLRKRNLVSRVEVAAPIEDERLKAQLRDILALCLYDTKDAWEMMADGRYAKPAFRTSEATLAAPLLDVLEPADLKALAQSKGSQAANVALTMASSL